jgi:hypothetical protein
LLLWLRLDMERMLCAEWRIILCKSMTQMLMMIPYDRECTSLTLPHCMSLPSMVSNVCLS